MRDTPFFSCLLIVAFILSLEVSNFTGHHGTLEAQVPLWNEEVISFTEFPSHYFPESPTLFHAIPYGPPPPHDSPLCITPDSQKVTPESFFVTPESLFVTPTHCHHPLAIASVDDDDVGVCEPVSFGVTIERLKDFCMTYLRYLWTGIHPDSSPSAQDQCTTNYTTEISEEVPLFTSLPPPGIAFATGIDEEVRGDEVDGVEMKVEVVMEVEAEGEVEEGEREEGGAGVCALFGDTEVPERLLSNTSSPSSSPSPSSSFSSESFAPRASVFLAAFASTTDPIVLVFCSSLICAVLFSIYLCGLCWHQELLDIAEKKLLKEELLANGDFLREDYKLTTYKSAKNRIMLMNSENYLLRKRVKVARIVQVTERQKFRAQLRDADLRIADLFLRLAQLVNAEEKVALLEENAKMNEMALSCAKEQIAELAQANASLEATATNAQTRAREEIASLAQVNAERTNSIVNLEATVENLCVSLAQAQQIIKKMEEKEKESEEKKKEKEEEIRKLKWLKEEQTKRVEVLESIVVRMEERVREETNRSTQRANFEARNRIAELEKEIKAMEKKAKKEASKASLRAQSDGEKIASLEAKLKRVEGKAKRNAERAKTRVEELQKTVAHAEEEMISILFGRMSISPEFALKYSNAQRQIDLSFSSTEDDRSPKKREEEKNEETKHEEEQNEETKQEEEQSEEEKEKVEPQPISSDSSSEGEHNESKFVPAKHEANPPTKAEEQRENAPKVEETPEEPLSDEVSYENIKTSMLRKMLSAAGDKSILCRRGERHNIEKRLRELGVVPTAADYTEAVNEPEKAKATKEKGNEQKESKKLTKVTVQVYQPPRRRSRIQGPQE